MKNDVLVIENPSQSLLDFVRKLRDNKEEEKRIIRENWDKYFPKSKMAS